MGKGVPRYIDKAKELYADSAEWGIEDAMKAILRLDTGWKEEDPNLEHRPETIVYIHASSGILQDRLAPILPL